MRQFLIGIVCMTAANLLVPAMAAGPPLGQNLSISPHGPRADRMTDDELSRAKPLPDEDGALWKVRLKPGLFDATHQLQGRPSLFAITDNYVITPFDNCLLMRDFRMGRFGIEPVRLPGIVDQVVAARSVLACTLAPEEEPQENEGDILLVRRMYAGIDTRLRGHQGVPWRMLFSPDATRLVSCGDDSSMRLWDVTAGKEVAKFPGYGVGGNASVVRGEFAAFSPDCRWLATAFRGSLILRDPANGRPRIVQDTIQFNMEPEPIRFAPDSKSLFAFAALPPSKEPHLRMVQFVIQDGKLRARRFDGVRTAQDGLLTRDGKYVVTWSRSPEVSIWKIATREEVAVLNVACQTLYDAVLAPSGDVLATAGDDGLIRFWNLDNQQPSNDGKWYRHHGVYCIAFSPDGEYLISMSDDGWLKVWEAPEATSARRAFYLLPSASVGGPENHACSKRK